MGDSEHKGFFAKAKDFIKDTTGVGQEKAKEQYHGTQYDMNKGNIKDSDQPMSERMRAGADAVQHKKEEEKARYNKEQYKENLNKDWNK